MPRHEKLSAEDEKAFLDALDSTWSAIGYDCLQATAQEKRIGTKRTEYGHLYPAEQITLSRPTVVCIVTDNFAGGNHNGFYQMPEEQYKRIRDWMMKTPGHIVDRVVYKRFTYKRYGA